ncbi:MAG TPA: ABC transporter permease [Trebonia sp.]|jgi:ABC-2 type transport system permease protein/oleandomycin transport system permease protein|nr:ABC transporter permease [Trebonia sp.]
MTTAAVSAAPRLEPLGSGTGPTIFQDIWDVTWRNLLSTLRQPQALVFSAIQPVLFVCLFRYAFGGAIHVPGVAYVNFLMPGIFAQSVAFGAIGTAVGLSTDLRTGLLERFRTLPMSQFAILAGRTTADLIRNLFVLAVMVGIGFAVGFRVQTNAAAFLAALGLVVLFGYVFSWGFVALGLATGNAEAAQAAGVPVMFLLVFASPAFIPVQDMPGWLQSVAAHQPLAALVNALRPLVLGGPTASHVLSSVAWSAGLLVVFAVLSMLQYRRLTR